MTTSTAIPTARQRKSRTRTTNVSSQPALLVSMLPIASVQLTHRAEVLACPACQTWCPLTLNKGTRQWKLVPHHTTKAGTPGARRCSNSNRLVTIDVTLVRLREQQVEASADVAARRPTKVLRKVKTPVPPALHQLTPAAPTADSARRAYETHRSRCAACTDPAQQCADGLRLEGDLRVALYREPERRAAQARTEQGQRIAERGQAEQRLRRRTAQWAERYPKAENADMVRRTTSHALHADTRRRLYGPDLQVEERDTRETARALAEARTEAAIREASPIRRAAARAAAGTTA
ncbi:hypothetical protein [Kitasatospora cheerisanensis]|uniref:Uncharacterized protein n=1 Tax=Kitasatospora cheerisanensis KCTC 2395 TaxID=1348663 RepID=A0A066YRK6_9ACTN|nr:hypothetical protein [Kitasatospora cheerisanensis]KDN80570.1 hypothetical protein KCH_77170 [Kitasatospora cheerisanensis KCTC 2395]